MRFREDLGFTSLDFMSFLGELEDTFDIELDETEVTQITTLEEALKSSGGASEFFRTKLIKMSGAKIAVPDRISALNSRKRRRKYADQGIY